jgi:hypothetical protein
MAIWGWNRYLVVSFIVIMLGHWSLIFQGRLVVALPSRRTANSRWLQGVQLKVIWVPGSGCAPIETHNKIFVIIFVYSMCFDLLILSLTTYKLINRLSGNDIMGRSKLAQIIFRDGLIYFVIAYVFTLHSRRVQQLSNLHFRFVANLLATVFMVLNLNSIISIIFNVPAALGCTVSRSALMLQSRNTKANYEISACHAVRRLTKFSQNGPEV